MEKCFRTLKLRQTIKSDINIDNLKTVPGCFCLSAITVVWLAPKTVILGIGVDEEKVLTFVKPRDPSVVIDMIIIWL